jgi:hypothetical protein
VAFPLFMEWFSIPWWCVKKYRIFQQVYVGIDFSAGLFLRNFEWFCELESASENFEEIHFVNFAKSLFSVNFRDFQTLIKDYYWRCFKGQRIFLLFSAPVEV